MARAAKELGPQIAKFKLERRGVKLTQAEELAIARVHQTLTIAMIDIKRVMTAVNTTAMDPLVKTAAVDLLDEAYMRVRSARPATVCDACCFSDREACRFCQGRGWLA